MAFAKRNYRKTTAKPLKKVARPEPPEERQEAPESRGRGFDRPSGGGCGAGGRQCNPFFGDGGGHGGRQGGERGGKRSQNVEFTRITGLFPAKSGRGYNAFVKPEVLEALQSVQEGDYIGVSFATTKDGQEIMSLWASRSA